MTGRANPAERHIGDDLNQVFADGSVFDATDEDLGLYLQHLCSGHIPNEMVRHREMNRCQVISTVKIFRFIDSVVKSNRVLSIVVVLLSLLALLVSGYSIWQSHTTSLQFERLIEVQENQLLELRAAAEESNQAVQSTPQSGTTDD